MSKVYKAFSYIFIITLLLRIVDVIKSLIIASKFGVSNSADIYMAVIAIPESMIILLGLDTIRGVVNSEYSAIISKGEKIKIQESFKNLFNLLLVTGLILVFILVIFRYQIIGVLLPGFDGERFRLAVDISLIIFPVFFFKALIGFFHSVYNSFHRFYFPVIVPVSATIIVLVSIYLPYYKNDLIYNLSIANFIGNAVLGFILFAGIYKMGLKPVLSKIHFDDSTKKILKSCLSILMLVICNQLFLFSKNFFASYFGQGAISSLNYAGYISASITSLSFAIIFNALLTNLSSYFATSKISSIRSLFLNTMIGLFFLLLPVCILFLSSSKEILNLIYLRGNFNVDGIDKTLAPFFWESLSLLSFVFYIIPTALFLAKKEYSLLSKIGSIVYLLGVLVNFFSVKIFGYYGVAVSGFFVTGLYGLLLNLYSRRIVGRYYVYFKHLMLILLSGIITFAVVKYLKELILKNYSSDLLSFNLTVVIINFIIVFALFLSLTLLFKVNYISKLKEGFLKD